MSARNKTFVFDRFDIQGDGHGYACLIIEPSSDGVYVKAEDAINREAVMYDHIRTLEMQLKDTRAERDRLNVIVNEPQKDDFLRAVSTEAEHQRQRWGTKTPTGKEPADWFWLVGYLGGKALHAHTAGNMEKAEHHIITTAAALANWHLAVFGKTDMRPGHEHGVRNEVQ